MRVGVLGGGFGIYGWASAFAQLPGVTLSTLERYAATIQGRKDLESLAGRVEFLRDDEQVANRSDVLVVARRPADQVEIVRSLAAQSWKGSLILEKPLAPTPQQASGMLEHLGKAGIGLLVGFSINETPWAKRVATVIAGTPGSEARLKWRFLAHHYLHDKDTWKRRHAEGGGALRFFAIHMIDWIAGLGQHYRVSCSERTPGEEDPGCNFEVTTARNTFLVDCDTRSGEPPEFEVQVAGADGDTGATRASGPFPVDPDADPGDQDPRIRYLLPIARKALARAFEQPDRYMPHVLLWDALEKARAPGLHP